MRFTATVRVGGDQVRDVLVDTEPDATVRDLARALGEAVGSATTGLWAYGRQLDDGARVNRAGLGDGVLLSLSPGPEPEPGPVRAGRWQLHAVAGRQVGAVWDLPVGGHELGRTAGLQLDDARVSRRHALLEIGADGAPLLSDLGSRNGTLLDGEPVGALPVPVRPGSVIEVGDTLLAVATQAKADGAVQSDPSGVVEFTRSPRIRPGRPAASVFLPIAPEQPEPRRVPVVAMVVPLLLGGVMALVTRQPSFLLFTLMSPVLVAGNLVSDRRQAGRKGRRAAADHALAVKRADADVAAGLAAETAGRRREAPDGAQALLTATLPTRRLWERRRTDPDAFVLRVGTADLPSELTVTTRPDGRLAEHRIVRSVPVTLDLRAVGVLGLAGEADDVRPAAWWLLVQLCTFHAPRDLTVAVLAPRQGSDWSWVRWLPHARPTDTAGPGAQVGTDDDTVAARVLELGQLLAARKAAVQATGRSDRAVFPAYVVVLDGARALRAVPGVAALLEQGPDVGIFALCLETEERLLPEECTATVAVDPERSTRLSVHATGQLPRRGVIPELMRRQEAELVARAMAPVRDVSPHDNETTLPDSARLLDVLGLEPPTVQAVHAGWVAGGRTTSMLLGVGADGPFELDLRRDGPHALIAGTTGSGKSELLQTMIASLAVANRPDAMTFVLVDYKGGSAFKDCVRLPHTVGLVTDLDTHLVRRALTSLGAELRRRERQLAAAGVKDIEDYQDLADRTPGTLAPVPRLVLVIDEFASMARELPEFVTGLVSIAQRGRSLGLHLLLATQRPSGVVSPEIRSNTNLRISLRVTDASDSTDVVDAADAARVPMSTPGRGFARLGHGALVAFQAGRVGGRRPGTPSTRVRPPTITEIGWGRLGYPLPLPPSYDGSDDVLTDLGVLVDVVHEAAQGLPVQRSPWLPPLPDRLLLDDLDAPTGPGVVLAWGLQDLPAEQAQRVRTLDLDRDGHLLVIGVARSGRSQLLRALAASACAVSPADLHLYALDCGNGALAPLRELPHCGAVVHRAETERAVRLLARLRSEADRRRGLLVADGFADVAEQRTGSPSELRLPHLLLMLDRWEGFTATLGEVEGGALTDAVLGLLREGASVGVHVVITGDRSLTSARLSSLTESKVVLRLADPGDVSLVGLHPRDLPEDQPPGRAVTVDSGHEVQTALLTPDVSGQAQAASLERRARLARERFADVPAHRRPFRVDGLPPAFGLSDALALVGPAAGGLFLPFGVGGDDLSLVGVDLAVTPAAVVAGPARSGRSTLLCFLARALLAQGAAVVLAAPRPSPLRDLAGLPGVRALLTEADAPLEQWEQALAGDGPVVVIVDDGEGLRDSPAGPLLAAVAQGRAGPGRAVVLAGAADGICTGFTGWQVEVKKARQGALLSPQELVNGDLVGLRLPRSAVGGTVTPGTALVHDGRGVLVAVVVPR